MRARQLSVQGREAPGRFPCAPHLQVWSAVSLPGVEAGGLLLEGHSLVLTPVDAVEQLPTAPAMRDPVQASELRRPLGARSYVHCLTCLRLEAEAGWGD